MLICILVLADGEINILKAVPSFADWYLSHTGPVVDDIRIEFGSRATAKDMK